MRVIIKLDKDATPIFSRMAKEAGMALHDLAEIACYNLIALYVKDKGIEISPEIFAAESDPSSQPVDPFAQR
jgi:hypothetical protein